MTLDMEPPADLREEHQRIADSVRKGRELDNQVRTLLSLEALQAERSRREEVERVWGLPEGAGEAWNGLLTGDLPMDEALNK